MYICYHVGSCILNSHVYALSPPTSKNSEEKTVRQPYIGSSDEPPNICTDLTFRLVLKALSTVLPKIGTKRESYQHYVKTLASIAQRAEHQIQMAEVPGSILTGITFYCWTCFDMVKHLMPILPILFVCEKLYQKRHMCTGFFFSFRNLYILTVRFDYWEVSYPIIGGWQDNINGSEKRERESFLILVR